MAASLEGSQGLGVDPRPEGGPGDCQAMGHAPRPDLDAQGGVLGDFDRGAVAEVGGNLVPTVELRNRRPLLPPAVRRDLDAEALGHGGPIEAEFETAAPEVVAEVVEVLGEPGGGGLLGLE